VIGSRGTEAAGSEQSLSSQFSRIIVRDATTGETTVRETLVLAATLSHNEKFRRRNRGGIGAVSVARVGESTTAQNSASANMTRSSIENFNPKPMHPPGIGHGTHRPDWRVDTDHDTCFGIFVNFQAEGWARRNPGSGRRSRSRKAG
jgi:hypothetical protein